MLSISNQNEIETDSDDLMNILTDYLMISQFVYEQITEKVNKAAAKDFMLTKLTKMVMDTEKRCKNASHSTNETSKVIQFDGKDRKAIKD